MYLNTAVGKNLNFPFIAMCFGKIIFFSLFCELLIYLQKIEMGQTGQNDIKTPCLQISNTAMEASLYSFFN